MVSNHTYEVNRSAIQIQVEMGVSVRMAQIDLLARNLKVRRAEERRNVGVVV